MKNQQVIEKMIHDMQLRGHSNGTQKTYSENITHFQEYFKKPATELWEQEIRSICTISEMTKSSVRPLSTHVIVLFDSSMK